MKLLAPCLLVLVASCGGGQPSCPAMLPSQNQACDAYVDPMTHKGLSGCTYGDQVCDCGGGDYYYWYCRSTSCATYAEAHAGAACTAPGLQCGFGFEDSCNCIGPDDVWLCCGGAPSSQCHQQAHQGQLCCGSESCSSACVDGVSTDCECMGNHFECQPVSCGSDGGT